MRAKSKPQLSEPCPSTSNLTLTPSSHCLLPRTQVAGSLLKYGLAAGKNVPPERTYHVTVMPCFDKKLEVSRAANTESLSSRW